MSPQLLKCGIHILINMEVINDSTKDLGRVKVHLLQIVSYRAGSDTDNSTFIIRTLEGEKLDKGHTDVWTNQRLFINAVPPSTKKLTCHIIDICYYVKVEVEVPLGSNLEMYIPITIGTAPLGTPIPSQARKVAGNQFIVEKSESLNYQECTAGVMKFTKACKGFPNFGGYKPFTVFVNNYDPAQALARLQITSAAKASPIAKPKAAAAPAVTKPATVGATKSPKSATGTHTTETANSQTTQHPTKAQHTQSEAPPPSYVEACDPAPQNFLPEPGKVTILLLIIPSEDAPLVSHCFKQNKPNLQLNKGKVLAFVPEIQFFPSKHTSSLIVQFPTQRIALSCLQNFVTTNITLTQRWMALVSENILPLGRSNDSSEYKCLSLKFLKRNAEFTQTADYTTEYNKCRKDFLKPLMLKRDIVTIHSGNVVYACGDWSSYPLKASEILLVVSKSPNIYQHNQYEAEFSSSPNMQQFKELATMRYSNVFTATFHTGDISQFQDV